MTSSLKAAHYQQNTEKGPRKRVVRVLHSHNTQEYSGLMIDSLSQQFLILQWVTFNSFINQIQGTKSLNITQYLSTVSQKSLSREASPKESKMLYSREGPLQKALRPFILSPNGSKVGMILQEGDGCKTTQLLPFFLNKHYAPKSPYYLPSKPVKVLTIRLVSAHRSRAFSCFHACVGVCLCNYYLKEEPATHSG